MSGLRGVTVSIVTSGCSTSLDRCLASLAEDAAAGVEVVVLDNASDAGVGDLVRDRHPWARLIGHRRRAGFGENHNTVIAATTTPYVYLLNDDCTVRAGDVAGMVRHLDEHGAVAAVGPRIVFPDGREQPSAYRFPSPVNQAIALATLSRWWVVQSDSAAVTSVDWLTGAALLLRRTALERVGGFDTAFFLYSEETDLQRRLRDLGYRSTFFPAATVVHEHGATLGADPMRRINEAWRSRRLYWSKHHSPAGARAAALLTGAAYALRGALAPVAARGRDDALALQARYGIGAAIGEGYRELAERYNDRRGTE